MLDEDVVWRFHCIVGGTFRGQWHKGIKKTVWVCTVYAQAELKEVLLRFLPFMGERRKVRLLKALEFLNEREQARGANDYSQLSGHC